MAMPSSRTGLHSDKATRSRLRIFIAERLDRFCQSIPKFSASVIAGADFHGVVGFRTTMAHVWHSSDVASWRRPLAVHRRASRARLPSTGLLPTAAKNSSHAQS